jgi:hypothetical protein
MAARFDDEEPVGRRATTPPSEWAGATRSWSVLRCVPATPGSVSVQFGRVHSQRSSEASPMRARLLARLAQSEWTRADPLTRREVEVC